MIVTVQRRSKGENNVSSSGENQTVCSSVVAVVEAPRLPSPTVHFETRMAAARREDAGPVSGRQALQGVIEIRPR
jgi:hypothetical protein